MADLYLLNRISRAIAENGQFIVATANDDGRAFYYTIGNFDAGLPELLLVLHVSPDFAQSVLNDVGKIMRERGRAFEDGELVDIGSPAKLKVVRAPASASTDYGILVAQYFSCMHTDVEMLQVLIPDPQGRFPDEEECDPVYAGQPVRGLLH